MHTLTHRERVTRALNHQAPDRVPLAAYTMTDVCYGNLREHLGLAPAEYQYQGDVSNVVVPHEDVLQHFDIDTRDVALTSTTPRASPQESDQYYEDDFGVGYRKHGVWFYYPTKHPLVGERTVADVDDYPWPEPGHAVEEQALLEKACAMRRQTDSALVVDVGGSMFATAWFLCGDDWFIDLATNPPRIASWVAYLSAPCSNGCSRVWTAFSTTCRLSRNGDPSNSRCPFHPGLPTMVSARRRGPSVHS